MDHFSSVNIDSRNVDIWLPPGYDEKAKYPVLYMHDGQMLFDSTTTWNGQEWGVDETITTLLTSNQIESVIIVGIWNTTKRHSEYFPQKPFESLPVSTQDSLLQLGRNENTPLFQIEIVSDLYLKFLVEELKPHIDNHYSTISGPEGTFIMGSSMGGLISMYAISEYSEIFGAAACLSTHWTGTYTDQNNPIPMAIFNYMAENLPDPTNHKLYFDYGTETLDALYEPFQQQADSVLIQAGFNATNWTTQKFEGQDHSERAWNSRLEIPLKFLLGK
ncbi:MAG: alpha/beta hydrolase-fold protein [Cytophagales bacterium]|nr:alpha/beta hydrolase-fold protein [Cytophagales bacterium]